jgi:DNA-binding response OmpR family regulator
MQHSDRIQLLIFDVIMPRKNGREAYEEIRKVRNDIRIIFSSGYTADIISKKGILEDGVNFISKPLTPLALLSKVREILR